MSKQLTIRGVSKDLATRLEKLAEARGQSVNATVLALLESAAGIDARRRRLMRYATWNAEDAREFETAVRAQRTVDKKLWKSR